MSTQTKEKINTTMLHLRMDKSLRNQVKKVADSMGVSISLVGEVLFKQFLEEKRLTLNTPYLPNKKLKAILDDARENRDNSKYWTTQDSVRDLMTSLKK